MLALNVANRGTGGDRMAIYMKYGSIKGSATTASFKDWIELQSFQWGVARKIDTAARGSTSREHSEPAITEVTVTKDTDISTPKLFLESFAGKLDTHVEVKFTTTTKGAVDTFLAYKFENTGISAFHLSGHGGASNSMPMESLTLNFTKIVQTFTGHGPS